MDEGSREKHSATTDDGVWGEFLGGMNVNSLVYSFSLPSEIFSKVYINCWFFLCQSQGDWWWGA